MSTFTAVTNKTDSNALMALTVVASDRDVILGVCEDLDFFTFCVVWL